MNNISYMRKEFETLDGRDSGLVFNGGSGGGGDMEARVAKLESDVSYIQRDISEIKLDIREIKSDQKILGNRIGDVEQEIKTFKTVVKASAAVVSAIIIVGVAIFGTYVNKILEALNGIVLK